MEEKIDDVEQEESVELKTLKRDVLDFKNMSHNPWMVILIAIGIIIAFFVCRFLQWNLHEKSLLENV